MRPSDEVKAARENEVEAGAAAGASAPPSLPSPAFFSSLPPRDAAVARAAVAALSYATAAAMTGAVDASWSPWAPVTSKSGASASTAMVGATQQPPVQSSSPPACAREELSDAELPGGSRRSAKPALGAWRRLAARWDHAAARAAEMEV